MPQKIIDMHNPTFDEQGYTYVEIRRGMYGLPQGGRIANDQLAKFLSKCGYEPCPITHGLWRHTTSDLVFALVVDDFGVRYTNKTDVEHLIAALKESGYKCSEDWEGERYVGLTLKWDYEARTCDISMPGYVERALQRFAHPPPTRQQDSPHAAAKPQCGAKMQLTEEPDTSAPLAKQDIKRVQEVCGTVLHYARAVDNAMLKALGSIASQQATGTENTMKATTQLLNYAASHPDAVAHFSASDMVLHIDSDASYLSEPKAKSCIGGYHYLSLLPKNPLNENSDEPIPNGPVHIVCTIMKEVVSSAAEAELAALFYNCKEACGIRNTLLELGHPQPPTPVRTDNTTASGIANDTVKQKRSKAIDMRFHWVRDRVRQNQFHMHWQRGKFNRADYFAKHHPATHHRDTRSSYLHEPNNSTNYFDLLHSDENESNAKRVRWDLKPKPSHSNPLTPSLRGEGVLKSSHESPNPSPGKTSSP